MQKGSKMTKEAIEKIRLAKKGVKYPNRKHYAKGITLIHKVCEYCKKDFTTNCFMPKKRFCNPTCRGKGQNTWEYALSKVNREYQKQVTSERKGELHPRWIKDRTLLIDEHKDRGGQLHRDWSRSVKNRDKWKCRIQNKDCDGRMESHHILSWKDHPELRYELNNGITLCKFHHPKKRADEIRLSSYFIELLKSS